jgi:hypothetical protein
MRYRYAPYIEIGREPMADEISDFDRILFACATEQFALDMPFIEVQSAYIMRRIVDAGAVARPGEQTPGDRWYVVLEVRHHADESEATVLYRVWRPEGGELRALLVTVK